MLSDTKGLFFLFLLSLPCNVQLKNYLLENKVHKIISIPENYNKICEIKVCSVREKEYKKYLYIFKVIYKKRKE